MIEYIYDVIRATAGEDITISAKITEEDGTPITAGCAFRLYDDEDMLARVEGTLTGEVWSFTLPANKTDGLSGRYWYCFCKDNKTLCFKKPLYLVGA